MRLLILGAGGYGQTVADVASQSDRYDGISFLDDNAQSEWVIGRCDEFERYLDDNTEVYPAFGNNTVRLEWVNRLLEAGVKVPIIIHRTAYVSPKATVQAGTVILPNAVVGTGVQIGQGVIINCGSIVDHGCIIESGCHICLGAIIKGENRIEQGKKIEAGVVIERGEYPL